MPSRIDHVLLGVGDVPGAIDTFKKKLGLSAVYGGSHPRGTHNGLVHFRGSLTYLELIGPEDREKVRQGGNTAILDWVDRGGGVMRFAIGTEDIASERARIEQLGLPFATSDGSRLRPDGVTVTWKTVRPTIDAPARLLPFFIEWPPAEERVAELTKSGHFEPHQAPINEVEGVTIAVEDLDAATGYFESIYGLTPESEKDAPRLGGRRRRIPIGRTVIELVRPNAAGRAQSAIDSAGVGPFLLNLIAGSVGGARSYFLKNGLAVGDIERDDDGRPVFFVPPTEVHGIAIRVAAAHGA